MADGISDERCVLVTCPVCESRRLHYAFSHHGYRVVRCIDCGLLMLNPQPSDAELAAIYGASYFLGDDTPEGRAQVARMKNATARYYLGQLARYRGSHGGRLLEVGCGQGDLLLEAQRLGYDVTGVEISVSAVQQARDRLADHGRILYGSIESVAAETGWFDVCVLSDVVEHVRNPVALLSTIRQVLKPGGVVFLATPSLDSWTARLWRERWMEFKPEHLTYFDSQTIQTLLYRAGFAHIVVQPGWKTLKLHHVAHRFPVATITPLVRILTTLIPKPLRETNVRVVASGMLVFASATHAPRPKVSVIVPAYNEAPTFEKLMESLLRKEVPAVEMEIVVVESNSTDGTREMALHYKGHPRVVLVLEDRPHGKGHAVRTGFQHATGDFIFIQDADLEYDLEDYDALLEPLLQGRAAFVVGSRHGGRTWKMRQFADQWLLSMAFNAGHWFFTMLINLLFRQRLKDPFTMFKVFRHDCLFGLTFKCNRFDFDFELLIKLVRKGYRAVEIPVNYRSRSFKEGKKVSVFRDPVSWLWALARLRFATIDPMRELERQRAQHGLNDASG